MTKPVCKPLLPIYDKPNIYYALSTLLMAHIREILVIVPVGEINTFASLMGNGQQYGVRISYLEQKVQRGIADAFLVGKDFIGSDSVCLILGDNIFYGPGFEIDLRQEKSLLLRRNRKFQSLIISYRAFTFMTIRSFPLQRIWSPPPAESLKLRM